MAKVTQDEYNTLINGSIESSNIVKKHFKDEEWFTSVIKKLESQEYKDK